MNKRYPPESVFKEELKMMASAIPMDDYKLAWASDLELAQASAAGNERAFEAIYHAQSGKVYSLCLRMLGNPTEAEDVTQEVFLQLYRKIGTFHGESALSTWLYRLTVNTVLMHLRRKQRKEKEEPMEEVNLQALIENPRSRNERSLVDRIALERAIDQLPEGYRNVLVLHDIEGYAHEDIGDLLRISPGTSKSQLHKARLKLRKLLLTRRGKNTKKRHRQPARQTP